MRAPAVLLSRPNPWSVNLRLDPNFSTEAAEPLPETNMLKNRPNHALRVDTREGHDSY
jgi:hypothetical protein